MQIQALLTTLLLATGAVAAPAESCMTKGSKVSSWKVYDFTYEAAHAYSSPTKSTYWSKATFSLENPVLSYKAKCKGSSKSKDYLNGKATYTCTSKNGDEATFTYNHKTGKLAIDQGWSCVAEGGSFMAKGSKTLKLSCEDSVYKTQDKGKSTKTSHRVTTCKPLTVKVPITDISAIL
ncbi:hypothetical protein B0J13DRAFT_37461 [Dactylonectria estremocensis]|uniref:AA1-like domain-containing protein n=1 Tax=Dactylonectria estremocensis TaxID=1079267 RepID=A0A9P9FIV0_9HYPO|nr:hypothetical protein B0J13DRAFT_37461 [Dactylonectria estremocensis]